jgi:DNA-3-methyladenine glycosylase II
MIHQSVPPDDALGDLSRADPVLARLIEAHPGFDPRAWLNDLPPMDAFGVLVFQVVGQQLSVRATRRILDRLAALFGGALPTPAQLLAVDPSDLAAVGLSRRKVATMRDVAQRFADGRLREQELRSLSDREVEERLTAVPGIGPWTVHGFLIIAFDRKDVVLPGDLALRNAIQHVYEMDRLPSEAEVIELAERWRPWRSVAVAYLFQAGLEAGSGLRSALAGRQADGTSA